MMRKTRILIVDDDIAIARLLMANLKARDYDVSAVANGGEALTMLEQDFYDLVILDIMMPGINGLETCRRIREWSKIPVIMLSAKGDERDKVKCLELGADDYITKPFGIDELMARIKTALRHFSSVHTDPSSPVLTFGDIEINFAGRKVCRHGKEIRLTPTEYRLLQELSANANKVLTHQLLLQKVWGSEYSDEREYLHVFINRLRRKLKDNESEYIVTVPRIGYQFVYCT